MDEDIVNVFYLYEKKAENIFRALMIVGDFVKINLSEKRGCCYREYEKRARIKSVVGTAVAKKRFSAARKLNKKTNRNELSPFLFVYKCKVKCEKRAF